MKKIYLDYAATTPVDPRVVKVMLPYLTVKFGNTSSIHSFGQEALGALEKSRKIMAKALNAEPEEIFFTGSATESNNLVLKGISEANKDKGNHLVISSIEHDCIWESAKWLEKQGFRITRLAVDQYGLVNPKEIEKAITKKTVLVSVMHANNEIGTIEPISEIGKICRKKGVLFHTDASQSFGKIAIDVEKMNIDLLTASSHKIYGPKGAALLYTKKGVKIAPLLHGGGQEKNMRSSTVNTAAIVGFAEALKIALKTMAEENQRITNLRNRLIKNILAKIPDSYLNGHPKKRLSNNANIRFAFVEGEAVMLRLNKAGIAVSTGSACSSYKLEPSHVLLACGLKFQQIHGSVRFSLGRWTTKEEIDKVVQVLPKIIEDLRKISPFKNV